MNANCFAPGIQGLLRLGVKFGLVGVASVLIYFGVLVALRPLVTNTAMLTAISYIVSAAFNYALQSSFTFRAPAAEANSILRYLAMHGICMTVNSVLMFTLVDLCGVGIVPAQVVVTSVVASLSFVLSARWVYVTPATPIRTESRGERRAEP